MAPNSPFPAPMNVISLQSGSNGNCIYVESAGTRLLIDAGISGRQAQLRLEAHGREINSVDALLISHDHIDHARCMGVYHRKFGLPVYLTRSTYAAAQANRDAGRIQDLWHFKAGERFVIGPLTVESIPTPHDAADGVAFVVDDGKCRVGILTDLGHVFDQLHDVIGSLDAVVIESNYDPDMLAGGPYPAWLKDRICGSGGHISNVESAELLAAAGQRRLEWACLAHLSEENNDPELALATHRRICGTDLTVHVAGRDGPTDVLEV